LLGDLVSLISESSGAPRRRLPAQLIGGWEIGLLVLIAVLFVGGAVVNPAFFGTGDGLHAVLRDTARYAVLAVGMTFVIVNKDIDLSVGSTFGLVGVIFSLLFSPDFYDLGPIPATIAALVLGVFIGLINGVLVTILKVPAFIATLTMLLIGRGFVLGLTSGKAIGYPIKARDYTWFFQLGETNAWGFNSQIPIALVIVAIGAVVLAKTRWGYETFATGGNEQAAEYAGIPTGWVRIRGYVLSSLCATIAGLMAITQDKGVTSQSGLSAELIAIAAVIIGGASILGGRGRIIGAVLGAMVTVVIDKVLREGVPIVRMVEVGGVLKPVKAISQLPVGALPAFLGTLLLIAVLIEPYFIRRQVPQRIWAFLTGGPAPPKPDSGGVAIEGVQTKGAMGTDRALAAKGIFKLLARRDAFAILLAIALWLVGLYLRPDYWWNLQNSFAILLNYTELALLTIGLTYVIANGDIDLSVGAVLALSGAATAFCLKTLGFDPAQAVVVGLLAGSAAGVINALLTVGFGLSAFIATLGMFYIARGLAAWIVAGQQLTGFSEGFNILGRKLIDVFGYFHIQVPPGVLNAISQAVSVQTLFMFVIAIIAGVILAYTPFGQKIFATGGNRRAADYAGINTRRVRFISLVFSGVCAAMAGVIYVAYYRSFNPTAGQFRELDGIASVIIGGGSIFGGYGTIIGALAGAAVITLIRALLSLQIITGPTTSFVMPQHWVNVLIGVILIFAVLADIWIRQQGILTVWWQRLRPKRQERYNG
jgi:ribose transport system permease protein